MSTRPTYVGGALHGQPDRRPVTTPTPGLWTPATVAAFLSESGLTAAEMQSFERMDRESTAMVRSLRREDRDAAAAAYRAAAAEWKAAINRIRPAVSTSRLDGLLEGKP